MQQHQHNLRDNTHVRWCTVCSACCFCPFRLSWPIPSCYSDWININFPLDKSKSTCILCVAFFPLFWWMFEYVYKCVQHVNRSNVHAFFAARRSNGKKISNKQKHHHCVSDDRMCALNMFCSAVLCLYAFDARKNLLYSEETKKKEKKSAESLAHIVGMPVTLQTLVVRPRLASS